LPVKNLRVKWINVDLIFFPIIYRYVTQVGRRCKFIFYNAAQWLTGRKKKKEKGNEIAQSNFAKQMQLRKDAKIIHDCLIKGRPADFQTFRKAFGECIPFVLTDSFQNLPK